MLRESICSLRVLRAVFFSWYPFVVYVTSVEEPVHVIEGSTITGEIRYEIVLWDATVLWNGCCVHVVSLHFDSAAASAPIDGDSVARC
jgi:hypothetical protein